MHVHAMTRQGSLVPYRAYTLPQRYTYPLDPQRLAALEAPRGMLTVRLVEAKDVPRMDLLGKTDCFCKCAAWPQTLTFTQDAHALPACGLHVTIFGTLSLAKMAEYLALVAEPTIQSLI